MEPFRYLRNNKATSQPSNLVFVDTETLGKPEPDRLWSEQHSLRLGVAISLRYESDTVTRRKVHHFKTTDEFWSIVRGRLRKRTPLWIIAHNVGFDMTILGFWQLLADGKYKIGSEPTGKEDKNGKPILRNLGFLCVDDPPTIVTASHHQGLGKITIVDSMNYWPTSLKKIGQSVGCEKTEMPDIEAPDAEWFAYCEQDVRVVETAFVKLMTWVKSEDLGNFKYTAPGQSFAAFRHRFKKDAVCLHQNEHVKTLERDSYLGGRLELFFRGEVKDQVFGLDVKSMYPFVMRERTFPAQLIAHWKTHGPSACDPNSLDRRYAAEVVIDSPDETYPIRTLQGMVFARGRFHTALCGLELERAATHGHIASVGRWACYRLKPLFRGFVDHFFSRRQEYAASGESLAADLCKLMLNSLYGKFGQLTAEWQDDHQHDGPGGFEKWVVANTEDRGFTDWRLVGKLVQHKAAREEHKQSFPAVAAWVTAAAREYLLELIKIAGWKNLLYCVTDALYVTEAGKSNLTSADLVSGDTLGSLAVECQGRNSRFEALHHFHVGQKQKFGSRKSKALEFPDGDVEEVKFEGLASVLSREQTNSVRVYKQVKRFSKEYKRGNTLADGRVVPFVLDESRIIRVKGKHPDVSAFLN